MNKFHQKTFSEEYSVKEAFAKLREETNGEILYGLTNDYMFRAVFQKNERALRGLLCAILRFQPEEIESCEIANPIVLGENIDEKTCILDLKINLNHNRKINLEMQVGNIFNWPKRSTYYLCTMYTDMKKGQDYMDTVPCIHIGIVTESPFRNRNKFISQYQFIDPEDGHIYSGDLSIIMIDLSQIEVLEKSVTNGSDNIKSIYDWARLFRARSWEEAFDMAKESEAMQEAVMTMNELSQDEEIKRRCLGRILYDGDMKGARLAGMQEGLEQGMKRGEEKERNRINTLNNLLLEQGRLDDLKKSLENPAFQEELLREFHL